MLYFYNCRDVTGFITAIEKMLDFYHQKGIMMLKSAVSVPGIARVRSRTKCVFCTLCRATKRCLRNV